MSLLARWTTETASATQVHAVSGTGGRAAGPAVPKVAQFAAQFLARRGPVVSDVVPDFRHMSFDFQLVLLEPRHVQFLPRGTALELAGNVLVVVANNPSRVSQAPNSSLNRTKHLGTYLVMTPVVLTPSVLCVTKNFP